MFEYKSVNSNIDFQYSLPKFICLFFSILLNILNSACNIITTTLPKITRVMRRNFVSFLNLQVYKYSKLYKDNNKNSLN